MTDWTIERWTAVIALTMSVVLGSVQSWYWLTSRQAQAAQRQTIAAAAAREAEKIKVTAEEARVTLQTAARHDALAEWQKLYGERDKELSAMRHQNAHRQRQIIDQQKQINVLRRESKDCEARYAALAVEVEKVKKIANGAKE